MEAEALRAARAARQRWAVPPQDLTLAQARSAHPPRRPTAPPTDDSVRAQLREYDGSDSSKTILVSVNGRVYNVWRV
eukprot:COSAG04_NODE_14687_length_559_cov_0.784783_1_plen_76_part_01